MKIPDHAHLQLNVDDPKDQLFMMLVCYLHWATIACRHEFKPTDFKDLTNFSMVATAAAFSEDIEDLLPACIAGLTKIAESLGYDEDQDVDISIFEGASRATH